jgi:hypothetical protein
MPDANPCRHFRNKKMYVPGMEDSALALEPDPNGLTHCWCNRTQREIGVDDGLVNLRNCALPERTCFDAQ